MCMTQPNTRTHDPRYLEVNAEHVNRFLQEIGPELRFDRARLNELPGWPRAALQNTPRDSSDTLIIGGMHGQMGLPGLRRKG